MTGALLFVHGIIWGLPMLVLIIGVGLWITVQTRFVQLRLLPESVCAFLKKFRESNTSDGTSSYRALCTALGATVGTGNIIGVAGAISLGGPGAIFWMWVCGLLAMGTKFAEATLAVRYRQGRPGAYFGGPMYLVKEGLSLRWHFLGNLYCVFGIIASFGVGNATQINAVISGINRVLQQSGRMETVRWNLAMGLILAVLVGAVLMGGAKRIGAAAELLVPAVSLFYMGLCAAVLVLRAHQISDAFRMILRGAFSPEAVTGGAVGSIFQALRIGCCRGVFTNEAGMGTASIAHAGADVGHPVEQGLMGIVEVFLDTIVLCTLTALVILVSGVPIPYGTDNGMLTIAAFSTVCGDWAAVALTVSMGCFAFATILGWGLYGTRCVQFLFGEGAWLPFAAAQTVMVVVGAVLKSQTVWCLSELFNGLMAIPNLIVLAVLTPELTRLIKEYIKKEGGAAAEGGNHADFHQCQPLRALSHEKVPSLRGGGGSAGKEDLSSEYRSA